ncbi:MAG TPA: SRPBCC family protein [Candidatus Limnocylindrales bacterium]|nr:SRPBCC family protein [Candidatus Limnocylindrales bacterium]
MYLAKQKYSFHDEWHIEAPLSMTWDLVSNSADWQEWWPGLKSAVITNYSENIVGSSVQLAWRSKTGYRLKHVVVITDIEPGRIISFKSSGDLFGQGTWKFEEYNGTTHMAIDWHVQTTKAWMNILSPVLRPIFVSNHDKLMRRGEAGLNKHLQIVRTLAS